MNVQLVSRKFGCTRQDILVYRANVGGTTRDLGTTLVQVVSSIYLQDIHINITNCLENVAGHPRMEMSQHQERGNTLGLRERKLRIMTLRTLLHMSYLMNPLISRLMKIRRNRSLRLRPMMQVSNLLNQNLARREDLGKQKERNFVRPMLRVNLDLSIGHGSISRFLSAT